MEPLNALLQARLEAKKKRATNKLWIISCEIAAVTATQPNRWLRSVKANQWACERALIDLKESSARNPVAYFIYLMKKYQSLSKLKNT